jgi:hypothetical protein
MRAPLNAHIAHAAAPRCSAACVMFCEIIFPSGSPAACTILVEVLVGRLEDVRLKIASAELSPEKLRLFRAVEVLERIASPEARQVLKALAEGRRGRSPRRRPKRH